MTITILHNFQSEKADGPDSTVIQPSNWNETHNISLASGKVLGRTSPNDGAAQELPIVVDVTMQSMIPPSGTTAQRPAAPVAGMIRFNTETGRLEAYVAGAWRNLVLDPAPV